MPAFRVALPRSVTISALMPSCFTRLTRSDALLAVHFRPAPGRTHQKPRQRPKECRDWAATRTSAGIFPRRDCPSWRARKPPHVAGGDGELRSNSEHISWLEKSTLLFTRSGRPWRLSTQTARRSGGSQAPTSVIVLFLPEFLMLEHLVGGATVGPFQGKGPSQVVAQLHRDLVLIF